MDSTDRPAGALSPWSPSALAPRAEPWDAAPPEAAAPPAINARVVVRALRRHWWQILSLWLVGSAGLMYLAYVKIKPQYEVFSLLEVEPTSQILVAPPTGSGADAAQAHLDTQVLLVTSPDVITLALRDPAIAALPRIRESLDPNYDLPRDLAVQIPRKGTRLIEVRMTDPDPFQAAAIVNAVVKSYRDKARDWTAQETENQIRMLKEQKQKFEKDVADQKNVLRDLLKRAGSNPEVELARNAKAGDNVPQPQARLTPDDYRHLGNELAQAEVARLEAQAKVQFLQEEIKNGALGPAAAGPPSPERLEEMVQEAFISQPRVADLRDQIGDLERQLDTAVRRVRSHLTDPATRSLRERKADLKREHDELWSQLYPRLKAQLQSGPPEVAPAVQSREQELRLARQTLILAQTREDVLRKRYKEVGVDAANANHEIIDVQFARNELQYRESLFDAVRRTLEQRELEQQTASRIKLISAASPTRAPASDGRKKMIAAAPLGVLMLVVGLFVLLEARSGRVADPDELSHRARLGVIGVVPPLPSLGTSARALSARGQRDEKRRIEEFVQSLDHLRVTLCAHRPGMSPKRCVLITSATGGEGKTTLAAQLAGRCAHAGLMTLLIDADLRRPSLGDLLEVPEGPGLVDVLAGEASPENALVVIGNAGGFHLLPAGTAGQDPSRLLHGDRLQGLIAQFRETFDIVIIDAPPVLAVPDALLLGRWTDGAVLAVRHDTSRFPLVERANKRLASIGVPVLGAVINGCRTMESSYGSYRYTPYAAADAPAAGPGPQDD